MPRGFPGSQGGRRQREATAGERWGHQTTRGAFRPKEQTRAEQTNTGSRQSVRDPCQTRRRTSLLANTGSQRTRPGRRPTGSRHPCVLRADGWGQGRLGSRLPVPHPHACPAPLGNGQDRGAQRTRHLVCSVVVRGGDVRRDERGREAGGSCQARRALPGDRQAPARGTQGWPCSHTVPWEAVGSGREAHTLPAWPTFYLLRGGPQPPNRGHSPPHVLGRDGRHRATSVTYRAAEPSG